MKPTRIIILLLSVASISACEAVKPAWEKISANITNMIEVDAPEDVRLVASNYDVIPGWKDDSIQDIVPLMKTTCDIYLQRDVNNQVGKSNIAGTYNDWKAPCQVLQSMIHANQQMDNPFIVRSYFEQWFKPYVVYGKNNSTGLFTGYYEAALNGSREKSARYPYPLYKRPTNLIMANLGDFKDKLEGERIAGVLNENGYLKPYFTREEIEKGAIDSNNLELVWVDSDIDAFFVQIQGSGRINFEDGSSMRIGYDGMNGHEYRSIGAELVEMGELEKEAVSMQTIRAWLEANPQKGQLLLHKNPSYVFFKELEGKQPIGAMGLELTPERSLAVDKKYIPLGVPMWLNATHPSNPDKKIQKMVVAQDTGGAIKGAVRGDYFWGYGERAEYLAGLMKSEGRYWVFIPKTVKINP